MDAGMMGIVATVFVVLAAERFGHPPGRVLPALGWAALAFAGSIVAPTFATIEGEPGFVIVGAGLAAVGGWLLFNAVRTLVAR